MLCSLYSMSPKAIPTKMFRFPSPDRPIFFGKVQKNTSRITCKEASTLIYEHTILSY